MPPKTVDVPFQLLFPLLLYYYAQKMDEKLGGEYSTDCSWEETCDAIDHSRTARLTYEQFANLLYVYQVGVMDKRKPFKALNYRAKNYMPLMSKFYYWCPDLFRKDRDGHIILVGEQHGGGRKKSVEEIEDA